jgi:predicted nucleic acid-binding protein
LSSELDAALRRVKPEKRTAPLTRRSRAQLKFLNDVLAPLPKLLYDTTVYIDILQGRFPKDTERVLRAADIWHSTVGKAELAAPLGSLDPRHAATGGAVKVIKEAIERIPAYKTIAPDSEIWLSAGILSGVLARLQNYDPPGRRRVLNDALVFSIARKYGMTVLTRNIGDFDLLQQLEPTGQVLFYDCVA